MFHHGSEHDTRRRLQTTDGTHDDRPPASGTPPSRTAAGAALLSVFPMAFVAAVSYPVVATAVLTLTVGMVFGGRHLRRKRGGGFGDGGTDTGAYREMQTVKRAR